MAGVLDQAWVRQAGRVDGRQGAHKPCPLTYAEPDAQLGRASGCPTVTQVRETVQGAGPRQTRPGRAPGSPAHEPTKRPTSTPAIAGRRP